MDVQDPTPASPDFPSAEGLDVPLARPVSPPDAAGIVFPPPLPPAWPPAPPPLPRVWTVFAVLVLAMGSAIGASVVYLVGAGHLAQRVKADDMLADLAQEPAEMLTMMGITMCVLFVIPSLAALMSPVPWRQRLGLRLPRMSLSRIAAGMIGAISVGIMLSMLDALGFIPKSETLEALGETVAGLFGAGLLPAVLVIGLMPGVAEELLFRGYVQTRLTERWGATWSIALTAILFGFYHIDVVQGVFAGAIGLFLGYLTERGRSIIPAMIAHAGNNTFSVLVPPQIGEFESPVGSVVLLVGALIVFLLCLHHVRSASPGPAEPPIPDKSNPPESPASDVRLPEGE